MAEKRGIEFYTRALTESFDKVVKAVAVYIVRQLEAGDPVNFAVIQGMLTRLLNEASKGVLELAKVEAAQFVVVEQQRNLNALRAFIEERNRVLQRAIQSYGKSLQQFAGDFSSVTFGRRGQDLIREIGLRNVERGILSGSIGKSRVELFKELSDRVPIFEVKDAQGKVVKTFFNLEIAPYKGKFHKWNPKTYADLVARTTRREAQNHANTIRAAELGTRLVKFNRIGKDYVSLKDPCAVIDGKAYSIEPGGTMIGNKYFAYWRTAIKGGFATPHPNCNHFLRPVSETLAPSLDAGGTFAQFARGVA